MEQIHIAFLSIKANRLRSALALLGMVIGVFTVIGMQSVMAGYSQKVESDLNVLGANTFQVQKYPGLDYSTAHDSRYRNRADLTYAHAQAISEMSSHVLAVGIENRSWANEVKYRDRKNQQPITVVGATPAFENANADKVEFGRFLTGSDLLHSRQVAVIGTEVVQDLFPNQDPIGARIKLKGKPFTVIGIFQERGETYRENKDIRIVIPYFTWEKLYGSSDMFFSITVRAASAAEYDAAVAEVTSILRTVRKVPVNEPDDFAIITSALLQEKFNSMTRMIRLAAVGIASISLIVAGIGIMNVMLVSMSERTREIGIRKAIGARRTDILSQFLMESLALSLTGGLIGIVMGILLSPWISSMIGLQPVIPVWSVLLAFIFCTFIGLFFGIYPAVRASKLDPTHALMFE